MEESLPSWSDKNSEIKGVGWPEWCESDAEEGLSSYQRTEWFKITPPLLDPWICSLLMVLCAQLPSAPIGVREAWSPEAKSLECSLTLAQWLLLTVLWAHWFLTTRASQVVSLHEILWPHPNTVPGSPSVSIYQKVNHLEGVFFSLSRVWCHTTSILPCLLLGQSRARAFTRLKRKGPRPHLPAGGEILQSWKKSLWDGDPQWRSYLHHANAERLGIEKIVFKHLDPKPFEK